MDIGTILPGEIAGVATQLDRLAGRLEVCAMQVRVATAVGWEGPAARLHRERVGGHADDITALAVLVHESARRVRELQSVAESRLDLVGTVDLTVDLAVGARR